MGELWVFLRLENTLLKQKVISEKKSEKENIPYTLNISKHVITGDTNNKH